MREKFLKGGDHKRKGDFMVKFTKREELYPSHKGQKGAPRPIGLYEGINTTTWVGLMGSPCPIHPSPCVLSSKGQKEGTLGLPHPKDEIGFLFKSHMERKVFSSP